MQLIGCLKETTKSTLNMTICYTGAFSLHMQPLSDHHHKGSLEIHQSPTIHKMSKVHKLHKSRLISASLRKFC